MSPRVPAALALADFRERSRRPAYLVTLAIAVVLGYLALPPATSTWVIMDAGGYRGIYNSAYSGTVTALAASLWLMIAGFYVVRSSIERDEQTRVGQVLAATPMSRAAYLSGKFASNLLVLLSMTGVLALTTVVLQLARGESRAVDAVALLSPFVLLTVPVLAVTAAAAVLFETVPGLRRGIGNIVWFFLWMFLAIGGGGAPLGGLGDVAASMRHAIAAQHSTPATEFSLGFTKVDEPLRTFTWHGLDLTPGFVAARLTLVLVAVCLALLPAAWFHRFDTARAHPRRAPVDAPGRDTATTMPSRPIRPPLTPLATSHTRPAIVRLVVGEARVLVQGVPAWWWLTVAALAVGSFVVPDRSGARFVLLAAWIWPVLIWSRLATQRRENGLESLLGAYPGVHRQLAAEWLAGFMLTVATGLGPLVRIAVSGDGHHAAAWLAGALFIPSLALLLGTVTRTHRTFQVAYLVLWYAIVNGVSAIDFTGGVLVDGRPAGPSPHLVGGLSLLILAVTFTVRAVRHATR